MDRRIIQQVADENDRLKEENAQDARVARKHSKGAKGQPPTRQKLTIKKKASIMDPMKKAEEEEFPTRYNKKRKAPRDEGSNSTTTQKKTNFDGLQGCNDSDEEDVLRISVKEDGTEKFD